MQLRGAGDWNDPRLLREQPGKRDLSRRCFLAFRDVAKQINQRLIRFARFRRKARKPVAEIRAIERGVFVHLSSEKASPQRAVWNETDSQFLERRQDFLFRTSPPQRVLVLQCSDLLDGVCATNRLHSCFRKTEVLHLSFSNQFLYRSRHIFDWKVRVNTMLIEQID